MLMCGQCRGTEIILVVSANGIILAADSKIVSPEKPPRTACKITQLDAENFFWADAGLDSHPATGFSVANFFPKHARKNNTAQTLDEIGVKILAPLQKELPLLQAEAPQFYSEVIKNGYILSLFAVRTNGEKIVGYVKDFRVEKGLVISLPAHSCTPAKGGNLCILLTKSPETIAIANTPNLFSGDGILGIDKIMNTAIKADPEYVGPPISILFLTTNGGTWLRQGLCPNIASGTKTEERKAERKIQKSAPKW